MPYSKVQAAPSITAKTLGLGRTTVKSLVSACYSITCFSWPDPTSKRLRKWKRSHRTESAGHRNLRHPPGWWHLLERVLVSLKVQVWRSSGATQPTLLLHGWPGRSVWTRQHKDIKNLRCRLSRRLLLQNSGSGRVYEFLQKSPDFRKKWILPLWPREADMNRQPCAEG